MLEYETAVKFAERAGAVRERGLFEIHMLELCCVLCRCFSRCFPMWAVLRMGSGKPAQNPNLIIP